MTIPDTRRKTKENVAFETVKPKNSKMPANEKIFAITVFGAGLLVAGILGYCFRIDIASAITGMSKFAMWNRSSSAPNIVTAISICSGVSGFLTIVYSFTLRQKG
jgi:hypothetical protein